MSETLHFVSVVTNFISILLALIGFYLVIKNWVVWKDLSMDIIKARVFLNKEFLEKNWLYVVVAGGLITIRRIYRYLELTTNAGNQIIEVLFDISGFLVILLLVLMAYQWYKLIHKIS